MIDDNTLECKFDEHKGQLHQDRHCIYMMVNMFLVEELSYNEHKRKGSGCKIFLTITMSVFIIFHIG